MDVAFSFLGLCTSKKEQHKPWARHYFSQPTPGCIIALNSLSSILFARPYPFFASNKNNTFKNILHRHIFSCCESLQCHGSGPPAALTCLGGKGEVELSKTPEQPHQIPNLRNLRVCLLCCPSPALLSSLSPLFQAVCFTSQAKLTRSQTPWGWAGECYLSIVTILWWVTSRICLGNRRIPVLEDGNELKVIGQSSSNKEPSGSRTSIFEVFCCLKIQSGVWKCTDTFYSPVGTTLSFWRWEWTWD